MKRSSIAVLILIAYLALVVVAGLLLHLPTTRFLLFCVLLGLLGVAALAFFFWYQKKYLDTGGVPAAGKTETANLDAILRDADLKLRQGGRAGAKSVGAMPLIYMIGDENSAKTQTVLQSGLEPELLAGQLYRDQAIVPTQVVNVWLAGASLIIEAGGALLKQPGLWQRLLKLTQPSNVGAAFSSGSKLPTRAVVVCVSIERILAPNTSEQIRGLAQMLNERLRQLSQTLGISMPVYVLLTKIDRIASFADYAAKLTPEEVRSPLGSVLAPLGIGAGLYAERATEQVGTRFDELIYSLSEFRLEVLSRGGEADSMARAYEFPRDLRKLRSGIVDFLVEIARPSQLGVNPFLRGFFFTGMRAHFIEDVAGVSPGALGQQVQAPVADANATRIFSFAAQQQARPAAQPVRGNVRKVPQWVFLPHLFTNILLADKSALESSRASTRVSFTKRLLLGIVCAAVFSYLVLLTISYFNNADLEHRVATASQAPAPLIARGSLPSQTDLQSLDQLRQLLIELDGYHHDGAPLMYRWGLYDGDALYASACRAYGQHFQRLLLSSTQAGMLAKLRAIQSPPAADAVYGDTYNPLKAYLITTSHPEKSTLDFLPAVLGSEWSGTQNPPADLAVLAQNQFALYAGLLPQQGSCLASVGGAPDRDTVAHAQEYLSHFQGSLHIYQSMIAAANNKFPSVVYNDRFPGSDHYIVDRFKVAGAFTKAGFPFMQGAIQNPRQYFGGDEWVLGSQTGPSVDMTTLPAELQKLYVADYRNAWRSYLNSAHFLGYTNWVDAGNKLSSLDSNVSPMLELFALVSYNTGVASPDIAASFQAPQAIVPPAGANTVFIANTNQAYIQSLQGLELAIKSLTQNPLNSNDPAAAQPVTQAAIQADMAAGTLRNSFTPDTDGKMDTVSFNLLQAPIKSASALAAAAPAQAAGGGAKTFCAQAGPVFAKFPFNPQSQEDATPEEVAQIFQPGSGSFFKLTDSLKQLIVPQGGGFVAAPGSALNVNPGFLRFVNTAQKFSSAIYPSGGPQASLDFTLTEVKDPASPAAVLNIDGEQIAAGGQSMTYHWKSQKTSTFTLKSTQSLSNTGNWSVFHFAYLALHPAPNKLEFHFDVNGQNKQTVQFEASGAGASLLNPNFMSQLHCVSQVAR